MKNYKDAPETTPYGKPMVTNLRGGGIFEILGTQGNGFMFEQEAAERFLSPAALSRAVEHNGYLCFAEKTTGNIVVYELGVGTHFQDMTQKDVKKATLKAAKNGFPPDFFRESYFDRVTFYCLPDSADFCFSNLRNCNFVVCRIWGARIEGASIYDTEFHTANMRNTTFFHSTMAHTHFHDSSLSAVSFQQARLKRCNTIDCVMEKINYTATTLDGCSFGRIKASSIRNLDTATITMGGATNEECQRNKESIYKALGVTPPQVERNAPATKRREVPER